MAFTYDVATDVGRVRMLIPDSNETVHIWHDQEIEMLLTLEGGRVKRAAALALETIASSEAMTLKVIKLLELTTDGAKTSDALLARAALLRKQAADDLVLEEAGADAGFEIAEWDLSLNREDIERRRWRWGY